MEKGIFTQRREIKVNNGNNLNCQIDDIYYAHATLPNALIHQVSFTNMDKEHDIDISNIIENQFNLILVKIWVILTGILMERVILVTIYRNMHGI